MSTRGDPLRTYRAKRSAARTPEPVPPPGPLPQGNDDTFVIHEHHATALHWDLRLERNGVLVSWAIPKGLPPDPAVNHLAIHTEDHPLEYASFSGEIPAGEYGGGLSLIFDQGRYETEKWTDREVKIVLHGTRARGRYVLFRTDRGGTGQHSRTGPGRAGRDDWMIHRMDPPEPGWQPLPELVRPMLATPGPLPRPEDDADYGYEMKWDGVRVVLYVAGGRPRALSRSDRDVTASYPELRELAETLGVRQCVLDGEVVAFDDRGRVSFGALQPRMHVTGPTAVRRLMHQIPVTYLVFDVLHLDGRPTLDLPYAQRRELLESLALSGPHWRTPPMFPGAGTAAAQTSKAQGLEGVVAKRLDSRYLPGRRSSTWIKVKNLNTQEVVIGGWRPGTGRRDGRVGSLLLGIPGPDGLEYVGHVGTGFTEAMLDELTALLRRRERASSPFATELPRPHAKDARWVTPRLVGEVAYGDRTREGMLRHASWRGLRPDKSPEEVCWE